LPRKHPAWLMGKNGDTIESKSLKEKHFKNKKFFPVYCVVLFTYKTQATKARSERKSGRPVPVRMRDVAMLRPGRLAGHGREGMPGSRSPREAGKARERAGRSPDSIWVPPCLAVCRPWPPVSWGVQGWQGS